MVNAFKLAYQKGRLTAFATGLKPRCPLPLKSMASKPDDDMKIDTLAETENYVAWVSHEPDGETVFHFELGAVTLHLYQEEFDEMTDLVAEAVKAVGT